MDADKIFFIDPGLTKGNAVALVEQEKKLVTVYPMMKIGALSTLVASNKYALFIIEDSNLIKASWRGQKMAQNIGKNKGLCKLIIQIFNENKVNYMQIKPDGYSLFFDRIEIEKVYKHSGSVKLNKDQKATLAMALRVNDATKFLIKKI